MPESNYRREDDKQWRIRTDERLASLTAGDTVQNDRLDAIEEQLETMDKMLRGDPGEGVVHEVEQIQSQLRRINAILWPDATGKAGLIGVVTQLAKKEERDLKRSDNRWKFITAVLVVAISSGLLARYLEKIEGFIVGVSAPHEAKSAKVSTQHLRRSGNRRHKQEVHDEEQPAAEETPGE